MEDFFASDAPGRATWERVRQRFGRDDRVGALVIELQGPLDAQQFKAIDQATQSLSHQPGVERVDSPTTVAVVVQENDRAVLRRAADVGLPAALNTLSAPPTRGLLLSHDRTLAVIAVTLEEGCLDLKCRRALMEALQRAGARWFPHTSTHVAGYPIHRVMLTDLVRSEGKRLYPWVLATLGLLLLALSRSIPATLLPLAVAVLAAVWTRGLMGLFGLHQNILSPGAQVLIAVIGVADAVHVLVRGEARRVFVPCAVATATTLAGFLALAFTPIPAIADFGIEVALGVSAALAVTFLLLPPLLPHLRLRPPSGERWRAWTQGVQRHRVVIIALFSVALVVGVVLARRISVSSPLLADLSPEHPVRKTYALLDARMGGVLPLDILVEGDDEAVYGQQTMVEIEALATRLRELPGVLSVTSPVDVLRSLAPLLRRVPDDAVTGLLPTALLLAGDEVRPWVDHETNLVRLRLRVANLDTPEALALFAQIDAVHREIRGTPAAMTGQALLGQQVNQALVLHFSRGFGLAMAVVVLLLFITLRDWRLALLSLVPNLVPMVFVLALMGAVGIELRYTSAVVLTVLFALAVDDTVHLLVCVRRCGNDALPYAGPGVLRTSIVLAGGFSVLLVSAFVPLQTMGGLLAATAVAAALADLILLPALLGVRA